MTFPRYADYKDSGIEWLGEVPTHWEVMRCRFLFDIKKRIAGKEGYDILSITQQGIRIKDIENNDGQISQDYSKYQLVFPGDFAMNHMDLLTGYVDIAKSEGVTSPDYRVFSTQKNNIGNDKYFLSVFQNAYRKKIFYAYGQGSSQLGRWRLPTEQFKDFNIPLPPLPEQTAIAAFLDHETGKIDALVAEQEKLIALLKEKRQAVISHAVTKGLDPSVSLKDSGIEWLGEVPEHWEVAAVSYRYEVQLGKMLDTSKIRGQHLRPYLRVFDVQWGKINIDNLPEMDFSEDDQLKFCLHPGDLMVNEGGSYVGRSAIWRGEIKECYYQKALHRLRARHSHRDSPEFMLYIMENATKSGVFVAGGQQATIEHLTAEALRRYRFAFPPHAEQTAIVAYLDAQTAKFDALTAEAERAIALLKERRSALISAAVTGKIDVRWFVAPTPQEAA